MRLSILTLFPEMFVGPFHHSIIKRAQEAGLIQIDFINIRDFATDSYKTVDDRPFGGGTGMILRVDTLDRAITSVKSRSAGSSTTILLDPKGEIYNQRHATALAKKDHILLICGHYEGVDARVEQLVDMTVSIGEFVVTGGEIPAMLIADSIARLIPGVLRSPETASNESYSISGESGQYVLEYPQYTRPQTYRGMVVPSVLLSGNHRDIEEWKQKNVKKTKALLGKRI